MPSSSRSYGQTNGDDTILPSRSAARQSVGVRHLAAGGVVGDAQLRRRPRTQPDPRRGKKLGHRPATIVLANEPDVLAAVERLQTSPRTVVHGGGHMALPGPSVCDVSRALGLIDAKVSPVLRALVEQGRLARHDKGRYRCFRLPGA